MTLTYPRDMTTMVAWNRADLTLMWRQEISKQGNGVVLVKDLGTPLWVIKYKSIELPLLSAQSLHAEYETLGGSLRTFYAHTAKRPYPASVNPLPPLSFQEARR